jgi:hypothetical protein
MARSYPFGTVPASVATVVSERFERPMVDCGYCSTQFAARTARAGVSANGKSEGHRIRALGGRAHWAGSNASEQRAGAKSALGVNFVAITKAAVLARVKQGFAVTISLQYIRLPGYLKVQTNDFGHCAALFAHRVENGVDYIGYFDPLYEQGSQGTWTKWADIDQALWDGGHNTTTVKYVAPTPQPPAGGDMNTADLTYWNVANAKAGKPVRDREGKVIHTTTQSAYPHMGTDADEYMVRLPGNVVGWIYKTDVGSISAPGPVGHPVPPTDLTAEQRKAIRKAEYERVVRGSIIQPPPVPE